MPAICEIRLVRVKGYENLVMQQWKAGPDGNRSWQNIEVVNAEPGEIEIPPGIQQRVKKKKAKRNQTGLDS